MANTTIMINNERDWELYHYTPLYNSIVRLHSVVGLQVSVVGVLHPVLRPQHLKRDVVELIKVQKKELKWLEGLGLLSYEESLQYLELFNLKRNQPKGPQHN